MYQLIERWGKVGVGVWLCMSCCEASCYRYKTVRIVVGSNQPHFRMVSSGNCTVTFWGRIFGRNWDKSLRTFPRCYSLSPLLTDFTPCPQTAPSSRRTLKILPTNLMSENSQDYAQKPQVWELSRLCPETFFFNYLLSPKGRTCIYSNDRQSRNKKYDDA